MKNLIMVSGLVLLLQSCENKKTVEHTPTTSNSTTIPPAAVTHTKPIISMEQLKAFFPATLVNLGQTEVKLESTNPNNETEASIKYGSGMKSIEVKITDGNSTEGASDLAELNTELAGTLEKKNTKGFEKIADVGGRRMKMEEENDTDGLESEIKFIEKNRFIIKLESNGYTAQQLVDAAKSLNYPALK